MARKSAYVAIAEVLRRRIESREYEPGDRLPAERELVAEFDVARMTIRHALDLLQMEGLIDRRRGRTGGTFVRTVPPMLELTRMEGINRQLEEMGIEQSHRVLSRAFVPASHTIAEALGVEQGEEVFQVEVLRLISDVPAMVEALFVSREYDAIVDHLDLSSIDALSVLLGKKIDRREDVITPGAATEYERGVLEVLGGAQLLRMMRKSFVGDEVVSFSYLAIRPDAMQVKVVTTN
ncbi:GntR family transcriptional regulator [Corynebacterium sp. S7]